MSDSRETAPAASGNPQRAWADRAADRSPAVRRSRDRTVQQAMVMVQAARRLIEAKGTSFTTQELAAEAGVALQTFYRHFSSKDHLLLALFEELLAEWTTRVDRSVRDLPDPLARLRFLMTIALDSLRGNLNPVGPKFMTAEHWRLYQLFPEEMSRANQLFADLIERELRAAAAAGQLRSADPAADAWLVMKLVMSVYHHYAFATSHEDADEVADRLMSFCLRSFGVH
ncbi:TetR/AcrR family transcriptional regulator [Actinocorallia populi]|uniref:TetR/AcrR family transcriptional regulator n=1 Tax=Actinocorallia populi TaxID=2079200 RepID=UPI000D08852D|nr:TetR/AcrR family transcriptional regulator [Actinocorallia populi]